jgi:hypothetical protein
LRRTLSGPDVMPLSGGQLLFVLQQGSEAGEWFKGAQWLLIAARRHVVIPFSIQGPRVLVVVTVEAQELPVASVRRIVMMIMVLVMDGELTESLATELPPAPGADMGENFERSLPISLLELRTRVFRSHPGFLQFFWFGTSLKGKCKINRSLEGLYHLNRKCNNSFSPAETRRRREEKVDKEKVFAWLRG